MTRRALDRLNRLPASYYAHYLSARATAQLRRLPPPYRLCLGSGAAPLHGFINIDLDGHPDLRLDLRAPLPVPDSVVTHIYSEHFVEHVDRDVARRLFTECRRVLRPDGVLRIATPDLDALIDSYRGDWRAQDWVQWPEYRWIDSAATMINQGFRGWGHRFLYDFTELRAALRAAGFATVTRCELGASTHRDLQQLESRLDSTLIVEAHGTSTQ